ncbi:cytochrome P450 [Streptomyces sp. MST-110588]|uniref:cytochrome P450 family protein n=1 Tax=Streptomyces sp. MST-110588 TaxID=2833628 RepID=UPI001F5CF00C|nr:cytochrome P450 [Streptomyces sp. MST-110588]UNO38795.1 cytochrome P450 [Streptomyces sp. MST-110588]
MDLDADLNPDPDADLNPDLDAAPDAKARFLLTPCGQDPHAEARALRAQGPVVPVELPGGVRAWLVTHQEAGRAVLADDRFVKDIRAWHAWQRGDIPADWPMAPLVTVANMTTATGTDHRRLRAPLAKAFTVRRVERLRPRIEHFTRDLLDDLEATVAAQPDGGPVDLRARFAHPLPIRVICELFGVPESGRPRLRDLCGALFGGAPAGPAEVLAGHRELRSVLAALLADKSAHPGDDLTSALLAAAGNGTEPYADPHENPREGPPDTRALSGPELVDTLLLMIFAGHETTVNLLVSAVHALLTHPGQLALARTGKVPWPAVVEEALRWDPPVGSLPFRYARCDAEVAGRTIRAGEPVILSYTAFGRDPRQHGPGADRFDITRTPVPHLSFGHGIHHCLGAPLARLEAGIALPALFARFPHLALYEPGIPPKRRPTIVFPGYRDLPVLLEPAP